MQYREHLWWSMMMVVLMAPWVSLDEDFYCKMDPVQRNCPCSCELTNKVNEAEDWVWGGCSQHRSLVPRQRWPTPYIPLEVSDKFNHTSRQYLRRGALLLETGTCLRFVKVTRPEEPYVNIVPGLGGCNSQVGYRG